MNKDELLKHIENFIIDDNKIEHTDLILGQIDALVEDISADNRINQINLSDDKYHYLSFAENTSLEIFGNNQQDSEEVVNKLNALKQDIQAIQREKSFIDNFLQNNHSTAPSKTWSTFFGWADSSQSNKSQPVENMQDSFNKLYSLAYNQQSLFVDDDVRNLGFKRGIFLKNKAKEKIEHLSHVYGQGASEDNKKLMDIATHVCQLGNYPAGVKNSNEEHLTLMSQSLTDKKKIIDDDRTKDATIKKAHYDAINYYQSKFIRLITEDKITKQKLNQLINDVKELLRKIETDQTLLNELDSKIAQLNALLVKIKEQTHDIHEYKSKVNTIINGDAISQNALYIELSKKPKAYKINMFGYSCQIASKTPTTSSNSQVLATVTTNDHTHQAALLEKDKSMYYTQHDAHNTLHLTQDYTGTVTSTATNKSNIDSFRKAQLALMQATAMLSTFQKNNDVQIIVSCHDKELEKFIVAALFSLSRYTPNSLIELKRKDINAVSMPEEEKKYWWKDEEKYIQEYIDSAFNSDILRKELAFAKQNLTTIKKPECYDGELKHITAIPFDENPEPTIAAGP